MKSHVLVIESESHSVVSNSCDPMDYTVHGILHARILEWVAFPFSRELPNPGSKPGSPTLQADSFINWDIREAQWSKVPSLCQWTPDCFGEPNSLHPWTLLRCWWERPHCGSQKWSHSPPQLPAWEASDGSQQDLGASLGPRANYSTSSKVLRGLGNLQGNYRRWGIFMAGFSRYRK